MKRHINVSLVLFNDVPNKLAYLFCAKLIKDTVASKYNKVKVGSSILKIGYIWVTDDNSWHSTKVWMLGLNITKSSGHRESPWSHSIRPNERVICVLVCYGYKLIYRHLLYHRSRIISLEDSLRLINSSAVRNDSFILAWVHWFMIIS